MGKIIAVTNQKGGVGKTTTSVNLAAALAYSQKRVLLVDIDPQANATQGIGINRLNMRGSIYEVIVNEKTVEEVILKSQVPGLDVVPSSIDLAGVDIELSEVKVGRESRLKEQLYRVKNNYDFIIIDCPPSLGVLNTNALTAADTVMIPVQCEYYALEGLTQLLSTIRLTQQVFNPDLTIEGVLLTMLDSRTNLGLEVVEDIRSYFKERVYDTIIPRLVKLSEAPSHGKPIIAYEPQSRGAEAYLNLAKEVIERNGE